MNQELLLKAQFLQKQSEEIEQNIDIVDREINDLQALDSNLDFLIQSSENSSISTIGKGIHIKTKIESRELLIEVGAGVVVKKTPEEARTVIQTQVKKLNDARIHLLNKLDIYHKTLSSVIEEIGNEESKAHQHTH